MCHCVLPRGARCEHSLLGQPRPAGATCLGGWREPGSGAAGVLTVGGPCRGAVRRALVSPLALLSLIGSAFRTGVWTPVLRSGLPSFAGCA